MTNLNAVSRRSRFLISRIKFYSRVVDHEDLNKIHGSKYMDLTAIPYQLLVIENNFRLHSPSMYSTIHIFDNNKYSREFRNPEEKLHWTNKFQSRSQATASLATSRESPGSGSPRLGGGWPLLRPPTGPATPCHRSHRLRWRNSHNTDRERSDGETRNYFVVNAHSRLAKWPLSTSVVRLCPCALG